MPRYLISFDAHAMDHIPREDMPAVDEAAHGVAQAAMNAGVWVFGGGLENQKASVVAMDGTVTEGPDQKAVGGFWIVRRALTGRGSGICQSSAPAIASSIAVAD